MNYIPLIFTLIFFEMLIFTHLLTLTINTRVTTTNYLLQVFCGLLLMVCLSLGAGKAIAMGDMGDNTKVEQESTR